MLSVFRSRIGLVIAVGIPLLVGAMAMRVQDLEVPGILSDRDYHSAIVARAYYFQMTTSVPEWRRAIGIVGGQHEEVLEPPIFEWIVAVIYRAVNGEHLWIGRLLASIFWLTGAGFLFAIAQRLVSFEAAWVGTIYYLFVPLGVLASRSFQPDSLMMMLLLVSLFLVMRYHDQPTRFNLLGAASVVGLALLIRPIVVFTILAATASVILFGQPVRRSTPVWRALIFIGLSLLPALIYYGYAIIGAGFLRWKVGASFMPHLLIAREFWKGWLLNAVDAAGLFALGAALVGMPMLARGLPRTMLVGLWVGYGLFGLTFNYPIHSLSYYHLQLIPIVALSFGPLVTLIARQLRGNDLGWAGWLPVVAAGSLILVLSIRAVRQRLVDSNFDARPAREIGALVDHSSRVVYLAHFYGKPLKYYAEISGEYWPRPITYWLYRRPGERALSLAERFQGLGFVPEYFVITQFREYEAHHADLREFLLNHCRLAVQSDDYLIYAIEACTQAFVHPSD